MGIKRGTAAVLILFLSVIPVTGPAYASGHSTRLENLKGEPHSLSEYIGKGKWVVFNIWGPKCPPCLEEVSELVSFHEDYRDKDAMVVSMALDFPSFQYADRQQVAEFVEDYFVTFPVLLGDSGLSEKITGRPLMGTPSSYLYDPEGRLAAVQVGSITQELIERFIRMYEATR